MPFRAGVRTANAQSDDMVELYKLSCQDFEALSVYYPEIVDFFRDVATVGGARQGLDHWMASAVCLRSTGVVTRFADCITQVYCLQVRGGGVGREGLADEGRRLDTLSVCLYNRVTAA